MGITLHPREGYKSHFFLRLLEFPLLIAFILSIALHVAAWKMLPDFEPLPIGKRHGWLRIFLVNSNGNAQQEVVAEQIQANAATPNNASIPQTPVLTQQAQAKPSEVPFFLRPTPGQNLFGPSNQRTAALQQSQEVEEQVRPKDRRWETQVRAQSQQRQFQINQAIAFFDSQQVQRGRPYFCELSINEDYSAAHLSCEPAQFQQELKSMLAGTSIRWLENKNGLPNIRILGQPIQSN